MTYTNCPLLKYRDVAGIREIPSKMQTPEATSSFVIIPIKRWCEDLFWEDNQVDPEDVNQSSDLSSNGNSELEEVSAPEEKNTDLQSSWFPLALSVQLGIPVSQV